MGRLILILGGARSGKSTLAERLAAGVGPDVAFVATAEAGDDEMRGRIAAHQAARPGSWLTVEEPLDLDRAVREAAREHAVVLVDCLTLWVSNHLCRVDIPESGTLPGAVVAPLESEMRRQITGLLGTVRTREVTLLVVSNEVGLGLVPNNPLGRAYRDLLGTANRLLAAEADQVLLMVAGIPVDVKRLAWEQP